MPSASRVQRALDALNFLVADVRDGLGPYLAVYLVTSGKPGWDEASAGWVMTLAASFGLVVQTPVGRWIDRCSYKRALLAGAALTIAGCCCALPWLSSFTWVLTTQALAAAAGCVVGPALSAITLGSVGPARFTARTGRNEAFNHLGNAVSAALAAALALRWGPVAVFMLLMVLSLASALASFWLQADAIDDELARGGSEQASQSFWQTLFANKPLLAFALTMALFHLANAAMLTSVGQLLARLQGRAHAASLLSICVLSAQLVMVPVAWLTARLAERLGRKPVMLAAFLVLALRGFLYPFSDAPLWLLTVQCLDGVGAGVFGVLFPVIVADLTRGTGRFNVSQGAVATVQGAGAALSASVAGQLIVVRGYSAAFVVLASIALLGLVVFAWVVPETRRRAQGGDLP